MTSSIGRATCALVLTLQAAAACHSPRRGPGTAVQAPRADRERAPQAHWNEPVTRLALPERVGADAPQQGAAPSPAEVVVPRLSDDAVRQLDLRGAPLSEALHLIGSLAGVNMYLDAGLDRPVDASFPAVTLDDALEVLLERNGLVLVEDPPGMFFVSRADGSEDLSRRFQLRSTNGGDLLENLRALAPGVTIVLDPNQNFVLARGPKRELDVVADYLEAADKVKLQVLIEVEILEIALDDEFQLGIEMALTDPDFLGEFGLGVSQDLSTSSGAFSATLDLNDFSLSSTIDALETFGTVQVISSPRVLAITNTSALIEVIQEIPYVETTTAITSGSGAGTVGTTSQASVAFKDSGIKLSVSPVVQEADLVQLSVNQEFSEVIDTFQGIPVLNRRKVENQFVVRGDQAVLLGGLLQDRTSEEDRGVPLLMHIPILGRLFRSDADNRQRRELLVMMTARVLDPEEAARLSRVYEQRFQERVGASGATRD